MADPVNDFSFDPYQVEETTLAEKLKQAMAKQLRTGGGLGTQAANAAYDRISGAREAEDVYKRRKEMSESYDRSLLDATKGVDPQVRDLLMSPGTRGVGLERLRDTLKRKSDAEEMTALRNQFSGGGAGLPGAAAASGGNIPSYEEVAAMSMHPNPTIAARGKRLEELYYKPHDPKDNIYAGGRPVPGADEAYARTQGAAAGAKDAVKQAEEDRQIIQVPNGQGGMTSMTRGEAKQRGIIPSGGGLTNAPAPIPATPAPSPAVPPASGSNMPASGPPTGGAAPSGSPVNLDLFKALERSGPTAVSPKGAIGSWQVMPQNFRPSEDPNNPAHQQAAAQRVIEDARRLYGNNDEAVVAYYNGGKAAGDAVAAGKPPPAKETQDYLERFRGMSPISSAQAGGMPPQGAPLQRPNAGINNTDPVAQQLYEQTMKGREAGFQKGQEKGSEVPETRAIIDKMKGVGDTYTGMSSLPMAVESFGSMLSGGKSEKGRNTEEFNKYSSDLRASIIKQYGTGNSISDADLKATLDRIPNVDQDPRTRAKLIAGLEEDMARFEWTAPQVRRYVESGVPLAEAQNAANRDYRAMRAQANPTQADGKSQALPSAAAKAAPAFNPNDPTDPRQPGFNSPFEGLGTNIANVAKAPFSGAGWQGFGDAQMNVLRGVGQHLGIVDRGDWAATKAEQEKRAADPLYAAGKNFGDVFNPTALIGGGATTIPKLALTGAAQAGLQPGESFTGQLWEGAKGGIAGGILGGIGKLFPTITSSVPDLNKYLEKFSSVKPTSAQLNPSSFESAVARALGVNDAASLGQVQALTRDLMKTAGIEGKSLSREGIDATKTKLGKEYDQLFPDNKRGTLGATISTPDQQALSQQLTALETAMPGISKGVNAADSPALSRVLEVVRKAKDATVNPIRVNPKDLHEAWKEVGGAIENPQAAAGVRKILEDLVGKGMSKERLDAFKALNTQYGTLQDIDRIFSMAGTGKGAAAGYLAPSKLEAQMGKGPNAGSATDEAAQLVKQLNLRDYAEPAASAQGPLEMLTSGAKNIVGSGVQAVDKVIQSLPAKKAAEALRRWGITSGQAGIREQTGD